jgi:hypothetical protein
MNNFDINTLSAKELRSALVSITLEWERRYGVAPSVTSAISEYDAAILVGQTPESIGNQNKSRTAVTRGTDFIHNTLRYQVKANRPSGKPGSFVTLVAKASNYDWDRLEGVEVGNPDGYLEQAAAVTPKQETISVPQPKSEIQPAKVHTQLSAPAKPLLPVTPPSKVVKEIDPPAGQPTLTDFGLYKCEVCVKMVMGFEKVNHEQEKHGGKGVDWKKVR